MKTLLSIGNSVSLFFFVLLVSSVIVVFSFDKNSVFPYAAKSDIPNIELKDSTAYQINTERLVLKMSAKEAKQFDKFEEFYEVVLERQDSDALDIITAPFALKRGNSVFFEQGVSDFRDGYDLHIAQAVYYIDKNVIEGKKSFEIKSATNRIIGENIYYDAKNGIAKAQNIKATFISEK